MDIFNFLSNYLAFTTEVAYKCPGHLRETGISISLHRLSHISRTMASDHAENFMSLAVNAGRCNWMVIVRAETTLFWSEGRGNDDYISIIRPVIHSRESFLGHVAMSGETEIISRTMASDHAESFMPLAVNAGCSNRMVIIKAETMLFQSEGCGDDDFTNWTEMAPFRIARYCLSTLLSANEIIKNDKHLHVIFGIYITMMEGAMHFLQSRLRKIRICARDASRAHLLCVIGWSRESSSKCEQIMRFRSLDFELQAVHRWLEVHLL